MTTAARCCVLAAAATSQLRASVGTMMAVGAGLVTTRALINGDDRRRSMALSLAIVGGTALKSRPGGCIQRILRGSSFLSSSLELITYSYVTALNSP